MLATSNLQALRKLRLAIEMLALYLGVPLVVAYLVHEQRLPLFTVLPALALLLLVAIAFEGAFSWRHAFLSVPRRRDLVVIAGLFIVLGGALTVWTYFTFPQRFLSFPRWRPDLWTMVMIFYPLASVTAQELVYRVLFFHRYAILFESRPALAIVANAALFSFGHLVLFDHWMSMLLTFAGGLIFGWRFSTTGRYWSVTLEHSLYGNLIFTIGLGQFFFTGVSGFNQVLR